MFRLVLLLTVSSFGTGFSESRAKEWPYSSTTGNFCRCPSRNQNYRVPNQDRASDGRQLYCIAKSFAPLNEITAKRIVLERTGSGPFIHDPSVEYFTQGQRERATNDPYSDSNTVISQAPVANGSGRPYNSRTNNPTSNSDLKQRPSSDEQRSESFTQRESQGTQSRVPNDLYSGSKSVISQPQIAAGSERSYTPVNNNWSSNSNSGQKQTPSSDDQRPEIDSVWRDSIIIRNTPTETTFISSNRTAERVNLTVWDSNTVTHVVQTREVYRNQNRSRTLLAASAQPIELQPSYGFVQTVVESYKHHHNLILRPDDIWTAIMVQFSLHVNAHAEELRSRFVKHQGRKALSVNANPGRFIYEIFIERMNDKLRENLNPQTVSWVLPNFTTTTQDDVLTNGVVLMATVQKYFSYEFSVACGIPEITLLGTVDDWLQIQRRVKLLEQYGQVATKWSKLLQPIMEQFVKTKRGEIDPIFWGDICRIHKESTYLGQEESFLDGWISAFSVFDIQGNWRGGVGEGREWPRIHMDSWAPGVVTVPVKLTHHGESYNSTLFAGHMGHRVVRDVTLQPYSGWALALD